MKIELWPSPKRLLAFAGLSVISGVLAYELHELGHFVLGWCAGLEASYEFTHVEILTANTTAGQDFASLIGGPLVTFALAGGALWLAAKYERYAMPLIAFSLANAWLRSWAMFSSLKGGQTHQDEYEISEILGLPGNTLVVVSFVLALTLFVFGIRRTKTRVSATLLAVIGTMVGMGIVNVLA